MFPPCPMASAPRTLPTAPPTSPPRWYVLLTLTRTPVRATVVVPWSPTRATTTPSSVLSHGAMDVLRPTLLESMPESPTSYNGSGIEWVEQSVPLHDNSSWMILTTKIMMMAKLSRFFVAPSNLDTMLFISTQPIKCVFQYREVNLTCRLMISWLEQKAVIYLLLEFSNICKIVLFCESFYCI